MTHVAIRILTICTLGGLAGLFSKGGWYAAGAGLVVSAAYIAGNIFNRGARLRCHGH